MRYLTVIRLAGEGNFLMLSESGAIAACTSLEMALSQFEPITDAFKGGSLGALISSTMTIGVMNPLIIATDKPATAIRDYVLSDKSQKLPLHGPNGDLIVAKVKDSITELGKCFNVTEHCLKLVKERQKADLN